MKNYRQGEIVLLAFPFVGGTGTKRRPALVLLDTGDADIVVARITSQAARPSFDVELIEWQADGLLLPSIVRLHKVATLEKRLVQHKLGTMLRMPRIFTNMGPKIGDNSWHTSLLLASSTTSLCHSEERSDEESRFATANPQPGTRFFAPYGRSE